MCASIFLAQVIGCYLFLVSLTMLINQQRAKKTLSDMLAHPTWICLTGSFCLILGLLIVIDHNIWINSWPVVVTLVGWILLLRGLMCLFFPDVFIKIMKDSMAKTPYMVLTWIRLIVGLVLIWAGFRN